MPTPATRRTVLAGMASIASPILASAAPLDPIHAAIAAHTAATMHMLQTSAVSCDMHSETDPRFPAADAASGAAMVACDEAAEELANTRPTTLRGVMALLEHVVKFDRGHFTLGGPHRTEAALWPSTIGDDGTEDGNPYGIPFGNRLLHLVHEALAGLA